MALPPLQKSHSISREALAAAAELDVVLVRWEKGAGPAGGGGDGWHVWGPTVGAASPLWRRLWARLSPQLLSLTARAAACMHACLCM